MTIEPQREPTTALWFQAVALLAGVLFGLGLGLSQMIDRDRILGFLDLAGVWDPTLVFVLGGAVGVTLISFRWVLRQPRPLLGGWFELPSRQKIDLPLLAGSALFGIGWGISGYCPGPAIAALGLGLSGHSISHLLLFLLSFALGSLVCQTLLPKKN